MRKLAAAHKAEGREIVVVMGVGFVGAIMAGVVADSVNKKTGRPGKFVIAMQRPSPRSYWKIHYLNRGVAPVQAEDPEVVPLIQRTVLEKKTLTATFTYEALELADVVVVDVQCDYVKDALADMRKGHADIAALQESFKVIGERIRPECLVLVETTVPPGTCERIAYPIIKQAFAARKLNSMTHGSATHSGAGDGARSANSQFAIPFDRLRVPSSVEGRNPQWDDVPEPLIAHSYERVMPGRNYVASVRDFWRVCSGINAQARERVARFLSEVLNVEKFPLTVLDRPIESETCKIVENSYRAAILAFMDEWSLFAERNGIDLVKLIQAIKVRPTHSNMLFPGPGIGGYCLPKDGALGYWAYTNLLQQDPKGASNFEFRNSNFEMEESLLPITTAALNINDTRALHGATLVVEALAEMDRGIEGAKVLVCGASYREDVGDTRYSGSELLARKLAEMGAEIRVHDPYVDHWYELEAQETYPAAGHSRSRFFENQGALSQVRVEKDLAKALADVDAVVFAVRHAPYLSLDPEWVVRSAGRPVAVVDCFAILDDAGISRYLEIGCAVRGLGRGHIARLKRA